MSDPLLIKICGNKQSMPYSIVKLDQDLRLSILEKVGVYSVRFSIQEPRTLLATKEVLEMPSEMTSGRRTSAYKYYVNVRKIPDEKVLENTIVHELVHMRFPYLSHGPRYIAAWCSCCAKNPNETT